MTRPTIKTVEQVEASKHPTPGRILSGNLVIPGGPVEPASTINRDKSHRVLLPIKDPATGQLKRWETWGYMIGKNSQIARFRSKFTCDAIAEKLERDGLSTLGQDLTPKEQGL